MVAIILYVAIGLVAGVCGGVFGIGGGIVIVPALVWLGQFDQRRAQGTSLVALLAPIGLLGLMNYYKAGEADIKAGAWIAGAFVLGAFFGSKIALSLAEDTMRRGFGAFLILVGVYTLLRR